MSYCILKRHWRKLSRALPEEARCYSVEQYLACSERYSFVWMHYNDLEEHDIGREVQRELQRRISADGAVLNFFTTDEVGNPGRFLGRRVWVHARPAMLRFLDRPDAIPAVGMWDAFAILCEGFLLSVTLEEWEEVSRSVRLRRSLVNEFRERLALEARVSPVPEDWAKLRHTVRQPQWWRDVVDPDGISTPEAVLDHLARAVGRRGVNKALGQLVPAIYTDQPLTVEQVAVAYLWVRELRGR